MATMSLEQVETLAMQLPSQERLKLAARICDTLSIASANDLAQNQSEQLMNERIRLAEQLMAEVEDIEDDSQGAFDAVADIRRIREERIEVICPSDA
jgi:hypothetical protein